MRPVFHQKTECVEGHIFITLPAYNLVHQIQLALKARGIYDSWVTIRTTLTSQVRTTARLCRSRWVEMWPKAFPWTRMAPHANGRMRKDATLVRDIVGTPTMPRMAKKKAAGEAA